MSDYTVGDTLYFMFTTRRFSTGAPFQLAGTPAVSVYEDAGTTEITAGITLGVDHDSRTGLNLVTVVASGANGYESGKDYHLVITTGTVDSVSVVGEVVGRFTLQKSAAAVDLANGTDGLGAIKTQTAAIEVDTADIQSRLPAALVSGRIDASVGAMAANVMTAAAAAADLTTELQSGLATAAAVSTLQTSVDDLPTNAELATALGTADDAVLAAIAALNDITVADIIAGVADGSYDLQEMLRVIFAACAGKSSGHESGTPAYRDAADTKNRISATTDANGNRTAVTLDAS